MLSLSLPMTDASHMSNESEREYKKQKPSKGSRLQCRRQQRQRQRQQQQQCLLMLGALSLTLSHLLTRACSHSPLCVWVCCCSVDCAGSMFINMLQLFMLLARVFKRSFWAFEGAANNLRLTRVFLFVIYFLFFFDFLLTRPVLF